jgi:pimeloyl-ACP methyl ester carboxylesterase
MTSYQHHAGADVMELDGSSLYYEISGSGPAVVLVHGMTLDTRMWDDQVPGLSEVATVIRYDARGFGRSTRDPGVAYTHAGDLWTLLDRLDVPRAALVGLSMGGRTVLEATLVAPERVSALVVMDAVVDGLPWDEDSARQMLAVGEAVRSGGVEAAKEAWLAHGFFAPAQRSPEIAARLATMIADYSGVHWTAPDPHGAHPAVLTLLGTITVPTTVIVGALDVPGFRGMAQVLGSRIPNARTIVVPDAGHMVNMEAPGVVTDELRAVASSL